MCRAMIPSKQVNIVRHIGYSGNVIKARIMPQVPRWNMLPHVNRGNLGAPICRTGLQRILAGRFGTLLSQVPAQTPPNPNPNPNPIPNPNPNPTPDRLTGTWD